MSLQDIVGSAQLQSDPSIMLQDHGYQHTTTAAAGGGDDQYPIVRERNILCISLLQGLLCAVGSSVRIFMKRVSGVTLHPQAQMKGNLGHPSAMNKKMGFLWGWHASYIFT